MRAPRAYWIDFIVYPVAIIIACMVGKISLTWTWCVPFGFLLFTFLEYWIHRVALHRYFYHGTHERHHLRPEEYVVFPVYYTPAIFLGFFIVLPLPVFVGFTLGYCWFVIWHDALHHHNLDHHPLIKRYAAWHDVHHKRPGYNFGITVPLWDFLFGTYRSSSL